MRSRLSNAASRPWRLPAPDDRDQDNATADEKAGQIFVRKPDNRLAAQRFPQRMARIMLPRRERISASHGCHGSPVQFAATLPAQWCCREPRETQTRIAFSDHFFRRQMSQRIGFFATGWRHSSQHACGCSSHWSARERAVAAAAHRQQTGGLLVNKLDAQMAAFQ